MTKQLRDVTPLYGATCRADNGFASEDQQSLQGLRQYVWDEWKREDEWLDLIFGRAKIKKRPVLNWVHSNTGRDQDLFGGYYINNELWPQYLV